MPKEVQFTKEEVVRVGYEIVKEEGFEGINARKIGRRLHSSVSPIFYHFKNMEELKGEIYKKIVNTYHEYMLSGEEKEKSYKQMGLSYIQFAKDYPVFFKIMLMGKTVLNAENFVMADKISEEIIKQGQVLTGLTGEEQKKFHIKVWIFTHGIASLVATDAVDFSKEEIEQLLENTVREMLIGYKEKRKDKRNGEGNRGKEFK